MARCFLGAAISPTPALRSAVSRLARMGGCVRAVPVENLHLTLRFLGEMPAQAMAQAAAALARAAEGIPAFDLELRGIGAFPNERRPVIVWAGGVNAQPLAQIVAALEEPLWELGIEPENRPWHAHLTLARMNARPPEALFEFLEKNRDLEMGLTPIAAVALFTSELSPRGPIYRVAQQVELP